MRAARQRGRQLAAALGLAALACGGSGGGEDDGAQTVAFYDVSGEIRVAFASAVDGDVNDNSVLPAPNDTRATAQALATPVTLGGYVNVTGQGALGRFRIPIPSPQTDPPVVQVPGDTRDYFRVSLAQGQTVRLFIADDLNPNEPDDLDLELQDETGAMIDFSDTNTESEAVVAPAAGEYLVEVEATSGGANYVLSIGQATGAASSGPPEFVPGEVIVRYRSDGAARGARRALERASADAVSLGLTRGRGGADGPQLFVGRDEEQLDRALRTLGKGHLSERARVRQGEAPAHDRRSRAEALRRDTRRLAKALRSRPDVESADLNYVRHAAVVPNDEHYAKQWHYPLIWLPEAWDLVAASSGVVVAVIDTGVKTGHPDLPASQLVQGYDFIQDLARANDGNGCDADANDPGDLGFGGSSYHGTHVAGTIAARTTFGDGTGEGVAGVAWNARVMPLRVLGVGGGIDFDLIQALRYAAGLPNACNALPAAPADVINLSLGGSASSPTLDATLAEVRAAGLVVVAAAGNSGSSQPSYPAASPGVISVAAVDPQSRLAYYSNFGPTIDLAAPGGDLRGDLTGDGFGDGVLSTLFADGQYAYGFYQGTSMAAPHVAGVVALMLGANPDLTPTSIDALLAQGAMTRDTGTSNLGRGLLDAFEAVGAARAAVEEGQVPELPPRLAASPGALNFGSQGTQATVTLSNVGGPMPPLSIPSFGAITDDGGAWLTIQATSVNGAGLGAYSVRVDRGALADGVYTGAAHFDSSAGELEVPVIVQVGDATTPDADAGHTYLLLVDDENIHITHYDLQADAAGGRYTFRFENIAPGRYYLYAGSDLDNDFKICDRGESCGSYPTLDQPRVLDVQGDLTGVDFLSGFGLRIGAASGQASQGGIPRPRP